MIRTTKRIVAVIFVNKRHIKYIFFALALFAVVLWCGDMERTQEQLAGRVLRLHVVANSDSALDQSLKLEVRDEVLQALGGELALCADAREAEQLVEARLPELEALASEVSGQKASAWIARESFDTREYDGFALPAGEYTALRIVLGEGAGHNWWCVVFPMLCVDSVTRDAAEAAEAVAMLGEENAELVCDEEGYVVRFRTLEFLQWLKSLFK